MDNKKDTFFLGLTLDQMNGIAALIGYFDNGYRGKKWGQFLADSGQLEFGGKHVVKFWDSLPFTSGTLQQQMDAVAFRPDLDNPALVPSEAERIRQAEIGRIHYGLMKKEFSGTVARHVESLAKKFGDNSAPMEVMKVFTKSFGFRSNSSGGLEWAQYMAEETAKSILSDINLGLSPEDLEKASKENPDWFAKLPPKTKEKALAGDRSWVENLTDAQKRAAMGNSSSFQKAKGKRLDEAVAAAECLSRYPKLQELTKDLPPELRGDDGGPEQARKRDAWLQEKLCGVHKERDAEGNEKFVPNSPWFHELADKKKEDRATKAALPKALLYWSSLPTAESRKSAFENTLTTQPSSAEQFDAAKVKQTVQASNWFKKGEDLALTDAVGRFEKYHPISAEQEKWLRQVVATSPLVRRGIRIAVAAMSIILLRATVKDPKQSKLLKIAALTRTFFHVKSVLGDVSGGARADVEDYRWRQINRFAKDIANMATLLVPTLARFRELSAQINKLEAAGAK